MNNIETGKISRHQFLQLIIGYSEAALFVAAFVANLVKNNSWLVILAGLFLIVPFVWIYGWLVERYPGYNLARLNEAIYGRYLGPAVSLMYIFFIFLFFSATMNNVGNFYITYFMPDTPLEALLIVFTFTTAYAAWNGIEVLARICPIIVVTVFGIVIITFLLLIPQMNWVNLLPVGELSLPKFIHATVIMSMFLFGTIVFIMTTLPFTLNNPRQTTRTAFNGIFISAFFFLLSAIRNTMVLGPTEGILKTPAFGVVRMINYGFISRLDILFALGHTLAYFMNLSLLFYGGAILCAQVLRLNTYKPLIYPLACILIVTEAVVYPSFTLEQKAVQGGPSLLLVLYIFILPLLSMMITFIRKLPKKGAA
jgi:spore germination protein KB